jgi:hypothetical protein
MTTWSLACDPIPQLTAERGASNPEPSGVKSNLRSTQDVVSS